MTQDNTGKVKLVVMRYNDYAQATMADGNRFSGEDRLLPSSVMENHWLVFTGAQDDKRLRATQNHRLILKDALVPKLGEKEPFLEEPNRNAIYEEAFYQPKTAYVTSNGESVRGVTSIVQADDIRALFPSADIKIVDNETALEKGYNAIENHQKLMARYTNTDRGAGVERV